MSTSIVGGWGTGAGGGGRAGAGGGVVAKRYDGLIG